jgi:hypothetical protein
MGGKSDTEIVKDVRQELSIEITNITNNISKNIVNTVTDTTNSIIQESVAKSTQNMSGINTISGSSFTIGQDSNFNIDQSIKAKAEMKAVISIVNDAASMQSLINKVMAELENKIKNDNSVAAQMQQAARLTQSEKDAGGPEAMVASIAGMVKDMIQSVTGGSSSDKSYTSIKTAVKQKLFNKTLNDNTFETNLKNALTNTMKQNSIGECKQMLNNNNIFAYQEVKVGDRSKFNVNQEINNESLANCLFDFKSGTQIVQSAGLDTGYFVKSDTENKNKSESQTSQDVLIKIDTEKSSAIMTGITDIAKGFFGLLSGPYMIIAGVIGLVIIIGAVMLFSGKIKFPKFGKKFGRKLPELSDEQDGGFLKLFLDNNQYNSFNDGESTLGMRDF